MPLIHSHGRSAFQNFPVLDKYASINRNLLAWWRYSHTDLRGLKMLDLSGNNFHGLSNATPTFITARGPTAANLVGANYFDAGNIGAMPSKGTIAFNIQTASSLGFYNGNGNIYGSRYSSVGGNSGFRLETSLSGALTLVAADNSGSGYIVPNYAAVLPGGAVVASTWYFITLSWDTSANTIIGYINNILAFSQSFANWATNFDGFAVGIGYNSGRAFYGLMQDFRIWSRILPISELQLLSKGFSGTIGLQTPNFSGFRANPKAAPWSPRPLLWK